MRYMIIPTIVLVTGLLLAAPPTVTEQINGKVVGVTDGDTITVLVNKTTIKVRLEGIDAPESKQSYGTKTKQALSEMVFGKNVLVKKTGEDRYGRTLGVIMLGEKDINAKMIEEGWAWHYKKYNNEERLAKLEVEARSDKRGLWDDPNALAPWDYRARQKRPEKIKTDPTALYWLNTSSDVRHNERCEYFKQTKRGRLCGRNEGKVCGICGG